MSARSRHTGQIVLAALLTALTAVCAQIQIPLPAIPLSLTTFAVYLCGALLPPRFSAFSMLAYALLGLIGVPVYAGFVSGPSVLFGPTGGFLVGFILCAPLTGRLVQRFGPSLRGLCCAMGAGTLVCYALGTAWFMLITGSSAAASLAACVLPFLPGDAVKIALAATLTRRLRTALKTAY